MTDEPQHLGTTSTHEQNDGATPRAYMPAKAVIELGLAEGDSVDWYLEDGRAYAEANPTGDLDATGSSSRNLYRCSECGAEETKGNAGARARAACFDCGEVTSWERVDAPAQEGSA